MICTGSCYLGESACAEMYYRPDIDGLRAIAVLSVLFFHCQVPGVTGGFVGVDIFFVISGYVITLALLRDIVEGKFSIRQFYERRVRRIFPALILTFAICWALAFVFFLPIDFLDFSRSLIASAASVANIYFWKFSGYFDPSALLRPLLHTWSLSVEEQYYLVMPATMWLCHKYLGSRFFPVLLIGAVLSFALSVASTAIAPTANFFLLPTRAWELLLGCLLAVRPIDLKSQAVRECVGLLGLSLIAFAVFTYSSATPFPGVSALAPCLGAFFVICSGTNGSSIASRFLSWRPLVAVGLISYSLYLFHWPLIVFVRYATLRDPTALEITGIIAATFALAAFSWKFVEQPFRTRQNGYVKGKLLPRGLAAMAAVMVFGYFGVATGGAQWRFPPFPETLDDAQENLWKTNTCFLTGDYDLRAWNLPECTRAAGGPRKILLWGDSFAAHYTPGLAAESSAIPAQIIQYTAAGCPPILSYYSYARPNCQAFNANALNVIRENKIDTVILSSRWRDLQQRGFAGLTDTVNRLKEMGVDVWVIGQSPEFPANISLIDYKNRSAGPGSQSWPIAVEPGLNEEIREASAGAHFIDPLKLLCDNRMCPYRDGEHLLYADFGHFSKYGSLRAVESYFPFAQIPPRKQKVEK